jgi:hypothetical protein
MSNTIVVYNLGEHQVTLLKTALKEIEAARLEYSKIIYLLVGPEHVKNPTLTLDLNEKTITINVDTEEKTEEA